MPNISAGPKWTRTPQAADGDQGEVVTGWSVDRLVDWLLDWVAAYWTLSESLSIKLIHGMCVSSELFIGAVA